MGYAVRNDGLGWRAVNSPEECDENETFTLAPPAVEEPTEQQLLDAKFEQVRVSLQFAIDSEAKLLGFSGGNALMLYVGFENAFRSIATTFAEWEATVWVQAGEYKASVLNGDSPIVTGDKAIEMMPPTTW